ncbi:MAG: TonB-dependent receptor domain-containing protein [Candidatus Acidiferrales bacterium]
MVDSSHAAVPDATVKVTEQSTNLVTEKDTNRDGAYTITNLLPGRYILTVEKQGFKTVALPTFSLDINQVITENIKLEVGQVTEVVHVSAAGELLQQSTQELGTTIEESVITEMPLNGRNFTELEILQPGVTPISTAQNSTVCSSDSCMIGIPGTLTYKVSINGQINRSVLYYLDGIINSDFRGSAYAYLPIADTIDEFKIQSHNSLAEYGGILGGVVNLATKGGTNNFHGSGWEFARSQIFDARNPFTGFCNVAQCPALAQTLTPSQLSSTPVSPLGYSQNEYGGTFGGPVFKNKTFFYVAYEGWRYSKPTNGFTVDPTAQELAGDFSGQVTPELIGVVNSSKTGDTPDQLYNPFAESGNSSAVPFYCVTGTTGIAGTAPTPMALVNPSAAFGTAGYGVQVGGGVACNVLPPGLINTKIATIIKAYEGGQAAACAFTPNFASNVDNCLDSRPTTDDATNMDARIDQHFGTKDTLFGRASMFWDTDTSPVSGTTSISPTIFHAWNIGGAWDHAFTPNLIFEARGGVNSKPYQINATNTLGYAPEEAAGFSGLASSQGFTIGPAGYPGFGNYGASLRGNPMTNVTGSLTWIHGRHNIKMGVEWWYENRLQSNLQAAFKSAAVNTCPTNSSALFTCGTGQGNGLASALLDLPSGYILSLPDYDEVRLRNTTWAGYIQDEWHVRTNLTIDFGLRYDFDPPVVNIANNGQTFNALDLPAREYIIEGSATAPAYATGCASVVVPPCIPGGLASVPNSSSIVFSATQPVAKTIADNIGPRVGVAWQFAKNTVLRVGYGVFYDTVESRDQAAQNTFTGSIWPFTIGVSVTSNVSPFGTTPTATNFPICATAAACGSAAGYSNSSFSGLFGLTGAVVRPSPWANSFSANDPSYNDPRSQQWQVNIERQLSSSSMISIAYVGSKSNHLDYSGKGNAPLGPFCLTTTQCASPVSAAQAEATEYLPFATNAYTYSESTGISNYNSLQAQFQKRFSNGLETLVAYTWSKCLSTSSGLGSGENGFEGNVIENFFNASLAYGVCGYDTPQDFNWSVVYQLPFGRGERWLTHGPLSWVLGDWESNFSFLARSGQAFNPTWGGASNVCATSTSTNCVPTAIAGIAPTSNDPADLSNPGGAFSGYSRPSVLPGCNVTGGQNLLQWYNPACFVSPASPAVGPGYGFGNAPVGGLRTQGFTNVDFSLAKKIPIRENMSLQLRFEAFNVFNHMVLGEPGVSIAPSFSTSTGAVSYGSAGVVSSIANTPRELQLAVKFNF